MSQRRLAAIMFSDIVGYVSLLKEDERKAFKILKNNQRIHKRLIRKFNGRWLKEMGSGTLTSFSSIIDAVMCSISIQKATEELSIPVRIGIHQGEVIFEKKDVLGDGVNIASRIHSQIDTHGIVISDTVYKDIKNKEGLEIESLGTQTLKGVDSPLGIYKVSCQDDSPLDFNIDTGELVQPLIFGRTTTIIGIIVIAILALTLYYFIPKITNPPLEIEKTVLVFPFENYLGSDSLEYFVAGMHDAVIWDLGKVSALRVKSKTTANAYRQSNKSIPKIAKELGVNTFVEGAVLCLGDSVCVRMKVFDEEEVELFTQDFKVEKSQILSLYNNITKKISNNINVYLTPQEESLLAEGRLVDPEAYDAYLKGQYYWEQINEYSLIKSMEYFQIAIEKDPHWGAPYGGMAMAYGVLDFFDYMPSGDVANELNKYLTKTLELDPNSANAHYIKAMFVQDEWAWEESEKEFQKALELNPSNALCRVYYAHLLLILHRFDEARQQADLALELDPMRPLVLVLYGVVMGFLGDHHSELIHTQKAISIDSTNQLAYEILTGSYLATGDTLNWYEVNRNKLWLWMDSVIASSVEKAFFEKGTLAVIKEIIKIDEEIYSKGGLISFYNQAERCLWIKNYSKAMDYFEKECIENPRKVAYASSFTVEYPELKDNPRYIALMKKMNLPVD